MNYSVIILLLSCITIAACADCKWSPCEGWHRNDQGICDQYNYGVYAGSYSKSGCSWDTMKRECCKTTPSKAGCKWSECYYNWTVCLSEFGSNFKPTGDIIYCSKGLEKYECCPN